MGPIAAQITIALALAATAAAQTQTPVFRSEVNLVRLLATVKDAEGAPAGSVTQANFRVEDNGVEQRISVFERHTEQPLSVAILIDNSGSTGKDLKYEMDSVTRFTRALFGEGNPEDCAVLYSFNWEVVRLTPCSRTPSVIERQVRRLKGEAGTSLYDALWLAADDLAARRGRHVMIVITDGGDTTSSRTFHQALEAVQRADAVIYPILVMPITNDAGRNIGGENALTSFALGTGGHVFAPSIGSQIDDAFATILRDLRTQFLIGYYPANLPPSKERFHKVKVTVNVPGLRVQTRSGYYGVSAR